MSTPLIKAVQRFFHARQGAIAIIFSLALLPLITLFALALNVAQVGERRVAYQRIADAAVLAGATASATDSDDARKTRALAWFNEQIKAEGLPTPTSTAASVTNGNVRVDMSATFHPTFPHLFPGDWEVKVTATAQLATTTVRRALDVVFCIDATGSMQNTINAVKSRAASFSTDLNSALASRGLEKFDYTRIRAVFYRDFYYDDNTSVYYRGWGWYQNPAPISSSSFFEMPGQSASLTTFLGTQSATGGGDLPESGYECIHEAMTSSWKKAGDAIPGTSYTIDAVYPVVVLWTDADMRTMPDTAAQGKPLYPPAMPRSQNAFIAKWNSSGVIDQTNRMLAMFGPCANSSWSMARSLTGYMCAGTLSDGNSNMVNKIADAMVSRYKNLNARLTH